MIPKGGLAAYIGAASRWPASTFENRVLWKVEMPTPPANPVSQGRLGVSWVVFISDVVLEERDVAVVAGAAGRTSPGPGQ